MIAIHIDRGLWRITFADGRTLAGRCATSGEALRAATRAALIAERFAQVSVS